jgi:DNA-directed RNA polymerase specialized sigma subunit
VNRLKQCSKDFYKWIDDIKKAYRHKAELEEKLAYYESRLVGYNAVTYDSISSGSNRNHVEDKLLFVIDKIEKVKSKLRNKENQIDNYLSFKSNLTEQEGKVLEYLVEMSLSKIEIAKSTGVSKTRLYDIIFSIKSKRTDY